jgi:peptidoglycan/LPS O-acetylase OafA/YrhL
LNASRKIHGARNVFIGAVVLALAAPSVARASDMTAALPYFFGFIAFILLLIGFGVMLVLHYVFKRDGKVLLIPFVPAILVGLFVLLMVIGSIFERRGH